MEELIIHKKEDLIERRKDLKELWASCTALEFYLSNPSAFGFSIEVVQDFGEFIVNDLKNIVPEFRGLRISLEDMDLFIEGSSFTEESSQEFLTLEDISEFVDAESEVLNQNRGIAQMA